MQQSSVLAKTPVAKPTPLILDKEGRTVDNLGRAIQLSVRQPTLKVSTHHIVSYIHVNDTLNSFFNEHPELKTIFKIDTTVSPNYYRIITPQ